MRVDKTLSELWHLRGCERNSDSFEELKKEASDTAFLAISAIQRLQEENEGLKRELGVLKVEINNRTLSNYRMEQKVKNYKYELEQLAEVYKDRESDIDFYWTTLLNIGKIAKDCDNDTIYDIVSAIINQNEFD